MIHELSSQEFVDFLNNICIQQGNTMRFTLYQRIEPDELIQILFELKCLHTKNLFYYSTSP
jgi:hypothetical protein